MIAWMRVLTVKLSNKSKSITFGDNWTDGKDDLSISCTINKYMSSLKDSATIRIDNLTYSEIVELINGKFYDVEIIAGYRNATASRIFKGGVLYISNSLGDRKTNTVIILCASEMIAKFGQARLNLSLTSGINWYTAMKFMAKMAGIKDDKISIDAQLKKKALATSAAITSTFAEWIEGLTSQNSELIVNSDSSYNTALSIFNSQKGKKRLIELKSDNINLTGGYPQQTNDGLRMTLTPTIALCCGDVIQIDQSLIDVPVSDKTQISKNYGYFIDQAGAYLVYEVSYSLQNRGSDFTMSVLGKSYNLIKRLQGE